MRDQVLYRDLSRCHQIHGELTHFYSDMGLVRYRFADMKPKDLLTSWIDHLLLGEMEAVEYPNRSILICRDSVWKFNPVNDGKGILKNILSRYWEGLLKPLPFFHTENKNHPILLSFYLPDISLYSLFNTHRIIP